MVGLDAFTGFLAILIPFLVLVMWMK